MSRPLTKSLFSGVTETEAAELGKNDWDFKRAISRLQGVSRILRGRSSFPKSGAETHSAFFGFVFDRVSF
jgi:hypothetical protein